MHAMQNFVSEIVKPKCISLISDIFWYIKEEFFTIQYGNYENINVGENSLISPDAIVIGFALVMMASAIYFAISKNIVGDFVRAIISQGCLNPESARTLKDLGYERSSAIRSALRSDRILRRYVRICVDEEQSAPAPKTEETAENAQEAAEEQTSGIFKQPKAVKPGKLLREVLKVDLENAKLFIDEDERYAAEMRYEKKGSSVLSVVLVCVVILVLTVLFVKLAPWVLSVIDDALSSSSGGGYLDR